MSTTINILKVGQIRVWNSYTTQFIIQSMSSTSCNLFEFASGVPSFTMGVSWVETQSTLLSDVED
jgi:hypothetical protein